MEIHGKKVLVLGGAGLVGMAVCREMIPEGPTQIIVSSLKEHEAKEACDFLKAEYKDLDVLPEWGNIFTRVEFKDKSWGELLQDSESRVKIMEDCLDDMTEDTLERSFLYTLILKHKPDVVIDCINSATAVAYQDVFLSNYKVRVAMEEVKEKESYSQKFVDEVEKLLCTLYIPQLIRHVQIFNEAMRKAGTKIYLKIGTSGTGGMGLNIPYTHSEEKPSRMLLSKSSVAGAHTLLLFLMARTPGGPIVKEVKPSAAIAWKKIAYGEIMRKGKAVELYDCDPAKATPLGDVLKENGYQEIQSLNKTMKTVFIDTGENGIFSTGEFEAISSPGQMELITPQEIAQSVIYEIKGGNTGHDIVNALDYATMGPTYRAGVMRETALDKLKELEAQNGCESVSFTLIGPFVSKLLFESHLIQKVCGSMTRFHDISAEALSLEMERLVKEDQSFRASILSVGIGILMSDGKTLLHGTELTVPPFKGRSELEVNEENINHWCKDGWVDLRLSNARVWKSRVEKIYSQMGAILPDDTSSQHIRTQNYWLKEDKIEAGKLVGWVLADEEKSDRIKR